MAEVRMSRRNAMRLLAAGTTTGAVFITGCSPDKQTQAITGQVIATVGAIVVAIPTGVTQVIGIVLIAGGNCL